MAPNLELDCVTKSTESLVVMCSKTILSSGNYIKEHVDMVYIEDFFFIV